MFDTGLCHHQHASFFPGKKNVQPKTFSTKQHSVITNVTQNADFKRYHVTIYI